MIDYNCFIGNWPFHNTRRNKFSDLVSLHKKYNIEYGYISKLESIFYNDPYESELDLYNEIKGSGYKQVMTINPALDICINTVKRAIEELNIKGVRLVPSFHDYNINDDCVKELVSLLKEYNLPLYINIRMEDERVSYLMHPYPVGMEDLKKFIDNNKDIEIMLCAISFTELMSIKECVNDNKNVYFDASGFKDKIFALPELKNEAIAERVRFGSMMPVYCFESSYLIFNEE